MTDGSCFRHKRTEENLPEEAREAPPGGWCRGGSSRYHHTITSHMSRVMCNKVDPGEEAECEAVRAGRVAGLGCDQCPGQCSAEGVECHEVSRATLLVRSLNAGF